MELTAKLLTYMVQWNSQKKTGIEVKQFDQVTHVLISLYKSFVTMW